ncbi:MAG: 5'/3'-nucleotidase SurE [Candidatus Eisenbacteria bacterium]|uniref:5'-nucleotidase SurE n=1 Tax=Eiseniibacteriota bacterium TaxID=2212470 RepID=A0A538TI92_UNCEI|nr:MAG: 5'/3'-nucleotidase SurE [Candidatus Eisenbacteria bacterium]
MNILITNDDGIHAPALIPLERELSQLGRVTVVVPDRDQSATSHSLTLHRPLRIHRHDSGRFSIDGTPTDCVLIAYHGLLDHRPDLVVSGINHGPNMGEDVFYSGTVAAAIEGAMQGAPSIAASLAGREPNDFVDASHFVRRLSAEMLRRKFAGKRVLNVNLPPLPWSSILGVQLTRLGTRVYSDALIEKVDPRGRAYYWIGGQDPVWERQPGTDFSAVTEGYISVTPLALDLTDVQAVGEMRQWNLET